MAATHGTCAYVLLCPFVLRPTPTPYHFSRFAAQHIAIFLYLTRNLRVELSCPFSYGPLFVHRMAMPAPST
ncbi:hypothetical protein CONLIGDRAFT_346892 [Coniochaeta ligniaria NRRL 30616]|uniref:Uncharacterized protein n=1 Tax=Coniochaeta ligniaria NRRL 30616 TaxID=1408157 RepID=A0A1J7J995_9PEZI|nr:hypothetical protein CONLIGDRAFT_346892 [Coniochaeta ligniaria NRRL 30616]